MAFELAFVCRGVSAVLTVVPGCPVGRARHLQIMARNPPLSMQPPWWRAPELAAAMRSSAGAAGSDRSLSGVESGSL
jgi:hypothetical protein